MSSLSRRAVLLGTAALIAGCSARPQSPAPTPTATPSRPAEPDPRVIAETRLVDVYDAALRAHPELAAKLRPIRADHAAHLSALRSAYGTALVPAIATPRIPASPLPLLQAAERSAGASLLAACQAAEANEAGLLGSIAACERSHLVLLGAAPPVLPPTAITGKPELTGLQQVLAAQNAVRWGYDVVGGQVSTALQPAVRAAQSVHAGIQDELTAAIRAGGADPVSTAAAYTLPFAVSGQAAAIRLAATLEDRSTAAWHYLLGQPNDASTRPLAAAMLANAAVQAAAWRARLGVPTTVALPGT